MAIVVHHHPAKFPNLQLPIVNPIQLPQLTIYLFFFLASAITQSAIDNKQRHHLSPSAISHQPSPSPVIAIIFYFSQSAAVPLLSEPDLMELLYDLLKKWRKSCAHITL